MESNGVKPPTIQIDEDAQNLFLLEAAIAQPLLKSRLDSKIKLKPEMVRWFLSNPDRIVEAINLGFGQVWEEKGGRVVVQK